MAEHLLNQRHLNLAFGLFFTFFYLSNLCCLLTLPSSFLLVLESIVIGVCGPEPLYELILCDVTSLVCINSCEEGLEFLVMQVKLEPDQVIFQCLHIHRRGLRSVHEIKALSD